jgi:hypothetical protein
LRGNQKERSNIMSGTIERAREKKKKKKKETREREGKSYQVLIHPWNQNNSLEVVSRI